MSIKTWVIVAIAISILSGIILHKCGRMKKIIPERVIVTSMSKNAPKLDIKLKSPAFIKGGKARIDATATVTTTSNVYSYDVQLPAVEKSGIIYNIGAVFPLGAKVDPYVGVTFKLPILSLPINLGISPSSGIIGYPMTIYNNTNFVLGVAQEFQGQLRPMAAITVEL